MTISEFGLVRVLKNKKNKIVIPKPQHHCPCTWKQYVMMIEINVEYENIAF